MKNLRDAFNALPAVVDDDFPLAKSKYELRLKEFLAACAKNGRLWKDAR